MWGGAQGSMCCTAAELHRLYCGGKREHVNAQGASHVQGSVHCWELTSTKTAMALILTKWTIHPIGMTISSQLSQLLVSRP